MAVMGQLVSNIFKNRKGHFDPICMAFPIVSTTLGIVFMTTVSRPDKMSPFDHYLLFGFALAVLLSVIIRTMKHGLAGLSAIIAFALVILSMLILRFAIGTVDPSAKFFAKNIMYFIPIMFVGSWAQQFIP